MTLVGKIIAIKNDKEIYRKIIDSEKMTFVISGDWSHELEHELEDVREAGKEDGLAEHE